MTEPSPEPEETGRRFTPPHAEPASPRAVRSNLIIASVLSGGGCVLVVLFVLVLVLL